MENELLVSVATADSAYDVVPSDERSNDAADEPTSSIFRHEHAHAKQDFTTPIACQFDTEKNMFRITRSRGNTLFSGGYGVVIPCEGSILGAKDEQVDDEKVTTSSNDKTTSSHGQAASQKPTYLFIEEVIVLYKQGLLEALDEHCVTYTMRHLYDKLSSLGISWPVFLVYAHLRQQTYRVVRHTPTRRAILEEMQPYLTSHKSNMNHAHGKELKQRLRIDTACAAAPQMAGSVIDADRAVILPAFDVYLPNSRFAKSSPGLPDFSVAVTYYQHCQVHFEQWHKLVATTAASTTASSVIKVAAVSDSGTVLVFGLTSSGVPAMAAKK